MAHFMVLFKFRLLSGEHVITKETIQHIAKLARLSLSDEETLRFSEQMTSILEHFKEISELDTVGVIPMVTTMLKPVDDLRLIAGLVPPKHVTGFKIG